MDHSQHILIALTALLFCTCAVTSLPVARQSEELQGLLSHLFTNVVSKLKTSHNTHGTLPHAWPISDTDSEGSQPLDAGSVSSNKLSSALKHGFLGFNKRQGYYDYGLGGGRFGKRYYGDYGIGGGRFGRDVDHVDIADTNDSPQ
ncbi:hypothetical protein ACOMHN_000954 [Nucella lapillus]